MSDITCRNPQCGEPWDAWGVRNGDMEKNEATLFLAGRGCPSCKFGYADLPLEIAIQQALEDKQQRKAVPWSDTLESLDEFLTSLVESTDEPDEVIFGVMDSL